ncbi:MAG: hypothetical protein A3Q59_01520 [Methanomethylophilus alvi]|nr:MAG: hypothetical protein A3Q59_01520 [Methanomethylophilus alvi]WII09342.1 AbrB/MazE/SpoVT family DNA-binding domain-containing protein [Methanomassiliicoccales archaeon LGM-DZ1]
MSTGVEKMLNQYPFDKNVDIRRVQVTGGSSFMITLPKTWAESVGLKKNDPVAIIPQSGGGLMLSLGNVLEKEDSSAIEIDADSVPDQLALYRQLIGAYIAGFRNISVRSANPLRGTMLESISKFTQTSIGMEIVEEDECRISMRDLMDIGEIVPQKNIRREYLLVKRMLSDFFQTASDMDIRRLDGMADRDTEVDRIHWLIQRQSRMLLRDANISASLGMDLRLVTGCVTLSKTIERMGDHAVLMSSHLSMLSGEDDRKVLSAVAERSEGLIALLDSCIDAWEKCDPAAAEKCIREAGAEAKEISAAFVQAGIDNTHVDMIAGSSRRLAEYCADIAELSLDTAMEQAGADRKAGRSI